MGKGEGEVDSDWREGFQMALPSLLHFVLTTLPSSRITHNRLRVSNKQVTGIINPNQFSAGFFCVRGTCGCWKP